ncbi:MAG: DUF4058 family protein [Planctomycetaceae bacterium]
MPSVFPGMDPFLERHEWEDFHTNFITEVQASLVPRLRPAYAVRTERRIYVEHLLDDDTLIRPDITILRHPEFGDSARQATAFSAATAVTIEPVERTLPLPVTIEETYLVIRRLDTAEVVTVIELLSPSNKRAGAEGRRVYLTKREDLLQSRTSLVEIDLLRGGERLPTLEPLPKADYFAFVCRAKRRRHAAVYAWPLNHRLPVIPIPLAIDDVEVPLDLQAVFDSVYDRAGYDYSLSYRTPVEPPLNEDESKWAEGLLAKNA